MRDLLLSAVLVLVIASMSQAQVVTIATFEDPSGSSANPLFTIDSDSGEINGGWADSQTGLNLNIAYAGAVYEDAWFEMSTLTYGGGYSGVTSNGTVTFHADGDASTATPILEVVFSSANLSPGGVSSSELFFANVTIAISGVDITNELSQEAFGFTFANQVLTPENNGFTATAAFTSSAIPEPITIALLGFGGLLLARKRTA
jgi:hypothetical protein